MYNNQKFKIIIFLILWGLNFASEELSVKNLMSQFNNEKKLGHFETADKIANQIIKILEIDPNLKNEQFANYLELFAEFYFQFEQDSIANELYFRSAKIYEKEIIRLQNEFLNPLISMDEIFNATSDSFAQSPYFQLINEISDTNRVSNFDSLSINPYSSWFPEIRYFDNAQDSLYIVEYSNDEAIELTNIAISYFEAPVIKLNIINFEITVLGEVNQPGTYKIVNNEVNVLYALSLANDITQFGNRKKVKVIRNKDSLIRVFYLDLTQKGILNNADFMLHPHDIVYVSPLKDNFFRSINNLTNVVSISISVVTLFLLLNQS